MKFFPARLSREVWILLIAFPVLAVSAIHCAAQDGRTTTQTSQPPDQAVTAPASTPALPAAGTGDTSEHKGNDPTLKIGVGDLVEMSVYNVPDLTTKTRVANDGEIYLPLISHVHVAGLTIEEAQDLIEERLSGDHYLKDPHVLLFVSEYASAGASILGEVSRPGIYPVLGQQHLFDLISSAGGLTEKAGHSIIVTHRAEPDKPVVLPISQNLAARPENNIAVFPGDTVIVRKADIAYVVGDVSRPSGFLMDRGVLTVLQAVALAGGTNRTAKLNGATILRSGPGGVSEVPVKLKDILKAKSPDIALQADDILVVPSSAGKILAGRTLEAAIQAATLVSVAAL
jgi:polysaccharide export outer membrane protein